MTPGDPTPPRFWRAASVSVPAAGTLTCAARPGRLARGVAAAGTTVVLAVHVMLAFGLFGSVEALMSPVPPLDVDHPHNYYYAHLTKHFLREHGSTWGYDPNFMAGCPKTALSPISVTLYELAAWALDGVATAAVYKCIVFGTAALWLLGPLAAAWLVGGRGPTLCWTAVGVFLYFWSGMPFRMVQWGMVTMALAGSLYFISMVVLGLAADRMTVPRAVWACLLCALVCLVHPVMAVALSVPYLAGAVIVVRRQRRLSWLVYAAVPVVAFLANAFWIVPALRFTGELLPQSFGMDYLSLPEALLTNDMRFVCIVFGVGGLVAMGRSPTRTVLVTAAAFHFLLAYVAQSIHWVQVLQPSRYAMLFYGTLLAASGHGATALWRVCRRAEGSGRQWATRLVVVGLAAKAVSPTVVGQVDLAFTRKPFQTELAPHNAALVRWLEANVTGEGRVAFENRYLPRLPDPLSGQNIAPLLPILVKAESIGGPYPFSLLRQGFAQFVDGRLCGRELRAMSLDTFKTYARQYNLTWWVCWSEAARAFVRTHEQMFTYATAIGPFEVYRVVRRPSFLYRGRGDVTAEPDRIRVTGLEPENDEAILCYHYLHTLRTDPETRIEPVQLTDDPSPFIRLVDPPRDLVVYNGR